MNTPMRAATASQTRIVTTRRPVSTSSSCSWLGIIGLGSTIVFGSGKPVVPESVGEIEPSWGATAL